MVSLANTFEAGMSKLLVLATSVLSVKCLAHIKMKNTMQIVKSSSAFLLQKALDLDNVLNDGYIPIGTPTDLCSVAGSK